MEGSSSSGKRRIFKFKKLDMTEKQQREILALTAMMDYITKKSVIDKTELREIEQRVDLILANIERTSKFFKRLA